MTEQVTASENVARTAAAEHGTPSTQASGVERRVAYNAPEVRSASIVTTTSPNGEPLQTETYAGFVGNRVGVSVTSAHPDAAGNPNKTQDRTRVEVRVGSRKMALPIVLGKLAAGPVQRTAARRVNKR